jgi:DNA repair protein RecO (recombination protein O)
MMKIEAEAVIIGARRFGSSSYIVSCFTREFGLISGYLRSSSKYHETPIVGNIVFMTWQARVEGQLGNMKLEVLNSIFPVIARNRLNTLMVGCMAALLKICFQERDPHTEVYDSTMDFLIKLKTFCDANLLLRDYSLLEVQIIKSCGFGMNITHCALTGAKDGLYYISPNTGSAVTKAEGERYKERLFHYPNCWHSDSFGYDDISYALQINAHFLEKMCKTYFNREVPHIRQQLLASVHLI